MSALRPAQGTLLVCQRDGRVSRVAHDGLGMAAETLIGQSMISLLAEEELARGLRFLAMVNAGGAEFDWSFTFRGGSEDPRDPRRYHLSAGLIGPDLVALITHTSPETTVFFEEFSKLNNEQANLIREMAQARTRRRVLDVESSAYEELSQLNNEFANLQRELARTNARLKDSNNRMNQAVGIVAHDLRSPLNVVAGYAQFLAGKAKDRLTEAESGFLVTICETTTYMQALIDDFIEISQSRSGKLELHLGDVDLGDLIRHVCVLEGRIAEDKAQCLEVECAPDLGLVRCDKHKIEQVLHNLVGNAIKFSKHGTTMKVRAEAHWQRGNSGPETVKIAIIDQGLGIPEDEHKNLFLPFTKTSVRPTNHEPSTGLGLSICRSIIEGHGGHIVVESSPGQGSTFTIILPRQAMPNDFPLQPA